MPEVKILFVATSDVHISAFHLPYLKWLKEEGYRIHLAVENRGNIVIDNVDHTYYLPFPRTLFSRRHYTSYSALKNIIINGKYKLIHCHTPIPSMITRLAARKARKMGTKVLYTAHGFHFFKGAPLKNWLMYYPAEYFLSALTDGIITINKEDFGYVNGKMFHKDSFHINGIGVDQQRFKPLSPAEKKQTKQRLGYSPDTFILLYVAEFIPRKNHQFIIESLPTLKNKIPNLKVLFAGVGLLFEKMKTLSRKLGVEEVVDFLSFRNDVHILAAIADIGISSSRQEGLGLGLAEEMLCSVPVVASLDKGHKELIEHGVNGFLFEQNDKEAFIKAIDTLYNDPVLKQQMGKKAFQKAQAFTITKSLESMKPIYKRYLDG